jgi:hypothetical protein
MTRIFRLPGAAERDPAIDAWMDEQPPALRAIARHWFEVMRGCGTDVREQLHDDQPTACVGDAAFAYVDAFTRHVNVGFFLGAVLDDPDGLLEGAGKVMRHVKIRLDREVDARSLRALIAYAYADMRDRLKVEG